MLRQVISGLFSSDLVRLVQLISG